MPRARERWIAAALVAAALVVGWPLFLPWVYDTHDGHYALYNAAQFDRALRAGELPVRWLPDVFGGRGLPVFVYFHPLTFYAISVLHLTGLGFIASMKIFELATLLLSGWTMLIWLEEHVPTPAAAVGAVAYVAAPMHVVEIHVKGDPPAALAYVFAPLVLLGIRRAAAGTAFGIVGLALASAGLVVSHSVTALLLLPLYAIYVFTGIDRIGWRPLARIGGGVAVGALIAAGAWGPALAERGLVYIDSVRGILAFDWREQFVAWWQLFSPLWGYHGSFPGTPDDMSFQIGPAHVAAIGLGVAAWRASHGGARRFVTWGLASAAIAIAMTTSITYAIWEAIDTLDYVQYPFRFLMPAALATAALAAAAVSLLRGRTVLLACVTVPPVLTGIFAATDHSVLYAAIAVFQIVLAALAVALGMVGKEEGPAVTRVTAWVFAALVLPWSAVPLHARMKGEPAIIGVHEADLRPERVRLGVRRTTARDEYLPRAVAESAIPPRDPSQEYLPPPGAEPGPDYEVRTGDVKISGVTRTARALQFETASESGGIVALEIHDFPGWETTLAGPPTWQPQPMAHGSDDAGRIVLSLPPGPWRVAARWTETPLRRRCDEASLAGLVIALALAIPRRGARRRPPAV